MNQKLANAIQSFIDWTDIVDIATPNQSMSMFYGGKEAAKIAFDYDRQSFDDEKVTEFENDFADWLQKRTGQIVKELPQLSAQLHRVLWAYFLNHPDLKSKEADWAELGAIIIFRALREHLSEQYTTLELDSYEAGIADTLKIKA